MGQIEIEVNVSSKIKVGIAGITGRMAKANAAAVRARPDLALTAVYRRSEAPQEALGSGDLDRDILMSLDRALGCCDVILDFTTPEATSELVQRVRAHGGPALVIGSTGLSDDQEAEVVEASLRVPIVRSGNFSLGVNMLAGLVELTARRLRAEDWDIEILEAHHRHKVDAPSGTALMLGEASALGRGAALSDLADYGRANSTGPRKPGSIGFSVVRGGGIIGEHSVMFAADDEVITLSHTALDRSLFARGAVEAAIWAVRFRQPGLYSMMDVLGFRSAG